MYRGFCSKGGLHKSISQINADKRDSDGGFMSDGLESVPQANSGAPIIVP